MHSFALSVMQPDSTGASTATASQEARDAAEAPATAVEARVAAEAPATAIHAAKVNPTAETSDATEAAATVTVKEVVEVEAGAEAEEVAAPKGPSSPSPLTAAP
jgi:hypothetical protein